MWDSVCVCVCGSMCNIHNKNRNKDPPLVTPSSAAARVASKMATGDKTSRIQSLGQLLEKLTKEIPLSSKTPKTKNNLDPTGNIN